MKVTPLFIDSAIWYSLGEYPLRWVSNHFLSNEILCIYPRWDFLGHLYSLIELIASLDKNLVY